VATAPLSGDLTSEEVASLAEHFEPLRAEELVEFASETFGGRLVLTCSWQLGTSILVHMTRQVAPETRLVEIDTGLLFPETHATRERLVDHYGLEVETLRPLQSVAEQAATHGDALWARDPDRCCGLRKVAPLEQAIRDADGWLTGIRRDQTSSRAAAPKLVLDARRGVVKVQPLVDWSERDCWRYIYQNGIPYNELHDRGFPSIGCTPCTRAIGSDEDARAGRWAGSGKTECGLHAPTA
jgi:phosphoadenosine phosphosulfate reductase